LAGNPEGKRQLGRPRRRWKDDIKLHLRNIGLEVMDLIYVAQDTDRFQALLNTVMNLRVS
jgi:hypothetical protein